LPKDKICFLFRNKDYLIAFIMLGYDLTAFIMLGYGKD